MTYEEKQKKFEMFDKAIKILSDRNFDCVNCPDNGKCEGCDLDEVLKFAVEHLKTDKKICYYGSELAMAFAEYHHDEEYLKELEERESGAE